jgi:DNA-binding NarL/FixJ family response regulator
MNILIHLNNQLLGTALCEFLAREHEDFSVRVMTRDLDTEAFPPDFIIVDNYSLRKGVPFRKPEVKVVMVDFGLREEEIISLLLTYRIDGVLSTAADGSLLKKALAAITAGQVWIDNRKIKVLIQHAESARTLDPDQDFSRKEREIVILISQGLMNREIAERLRISEQTVKTHISRIFRKVNVTRRSQLVPLALKFTSLSP